VKEYTKSLDVHPCKLERDDLLKLITIVKETFPISERKEDFKVSTNFPNISIRENSIEDFLAHKELPQRFNRLSIEIIGWDKNSKIDKTVRMTFYDNFIELDVNGVDETWVLGKYAQITNFLSKKRPWFWALHGKVFPYLIGAIPVISICGLIYFIKVKEIPYLVSIAIFLIAWLFATVHFLRGTFLPYTQIILTPKKSSLFSKENIIILIAIFTLIFTIVGVITSLVK